MITFNILIKVHHYCDAKNNKLQICGAIASVVTSVIMEQIRVTIAIMSCTSSQLTSGLIQVRC